MWERANDVYVTHLEGQGENLSGYGYDVSDTDAHR